MEEVTNKTTHNSIYLLPVYKNFGSNCAPCFIEVWLNDFKYLIVHHGTLAFTPVAYSNGVLTAINILN